MHPSPVTVDGILTRIPSHSSSPHNTQEIRAVEYQKSDEHLTAYHRLPHPFEFSLSRKVHAPSLDFLDFDMIGKPV